MTVCGRKHVTVTGRAGGPVVTVPTLVAQCSSDATGHCPQLAAPEGTADAITGFVRAGH
ncbi:hypothetical protein [Streptomyces sp. BPTC-684]|uniref:hypothetical protein n=1 Tax=Streptomyces sp. BPTC-684 TaxID=3043734 RepID=UPI0024B077C5|nr:hypothetical protein [Streptomyces sp. BPTC-684]WHM40603.1 hypothetical protein QIY60_29535 [Streptomyces sp. BPTC-684]